MASAAAARPFPVPPHFPGMSSDASNAAMQEAVAALDALVLGGRQTVSARTASLSLGVSSTAAKAALRAYVTARPDDVSAVWVVVSRSEGGAVPSRKVQLVKDPAPDVRAKASVWAVAPAAAAPPDGNPGGWVAGDVSRDIKLLNDPIDVRNSLRVEQTSVFKSESAGWNDTPRKIAGNSVGGFGKAVSRPSKSNVKKEGGLKFGNVGSNAAKTEKPDSGTKVEEKEPAKKTKKRGGASRMSAMNALVERIKAEEEVREKELAAKKKSGLFEPLPPKEKAAPASSKKKAAKKKDRPPPRKTRRIVDDSDEDDSDKENSDEEEDRAEQERLRLEAEEAEEASRCREAIDLGSGDGKASDLDAKPEDEGNELMDLEGTPSPTGKRELEESPVVEARPAKRIRRKVKTVVKDGTYKKVVLVDKFFDEAGNELPPETPVDSKENFSESKTAEASKVEPDPQETKPEKRPESGGSKKKENKKLAKSSKGSKPSASKPAGSTGDTKSKSKTKPSAGVSKKGKGKASQKNIMSFFSKK